METINKTDRKSLELCEKFVKLINKGVRNKSIPFWWANEKIIRFEDIKKSLFEEHSEEHSENVFEELHRAVSNLNGAIRKSKI